MTMSDPIADMLTRIRNAVRVRKSVVDVPSSKMKAGIAAVLKREGFISDFKVVEEGSYGMIRVFLKYGRHGVPVIQEIQRVSKPSRRVYKGVSEIVPVLRGIGIAVVSTARGILSDRECRRDQIGGEILCTVW